MAGKRLLDLAALFNASRGVAQKHIALRSRQLDVYNRTSTLARAVRNQTDRVTETAKAASFLVSRLNEDAPAWTSESPEDKPSQQSNDATGAKSPSPAPKPKTGPEQEPSHGGPKGHTLSADAARTIQRQSELQIPSKTADAVGDPVVDPLEEGHDKESFYHRSGHTSPALSSLPRVKIPKHVSNAQGSSVEFPDGQINSDSFYNAGERKGQVSSVAAEPEEEPIPEGIDTNLFHSARVAKLLGGQTIGGGRKSGLEMNRPKNTPVEHTKPRADKDQDIFSDPDSSQKKPTSSETIAEPRIDSSGSSDGANEDIEKLAQKVQVGAS
jgi:aarF domain-containing kinase